MKIPHINTSFGQGGYVNDPKTITELYYAADIYLFPTLAKTFETTFVEAISCGLPVVTFETSGMPEIVENEKSSLNIILNNKE